MVEHIQLHAHPAKTKISLCIGTVLLAMHSVSSQETKMSCALWRSTWGPVILQECTGWSESNGCRIILRFCCGLRFKAHYRNDQPNWAASWQNQQNDLRPAKTQISLGIRPVWSESSLSTWRKLGSSATHWAHSEDSDQTLRMPRLIWVFAGCTSFCLFCHEVAHYWNDQVLKYLYQLI